MLRSNEQLRRIDVQVTNFMADYGPTLLRISLALIFFWFGVLKFFPGLSPAEGIAGKTLDTMTFGLLSGRPAMIALAALETVIGLGLLFGVYLRVVILLLFLQMLGTLTPFLLFPGELFIQIPFVPTLEGQYIIKNFVLMSAALIVGATVRGGRMVADPEVASVLEKKRHAHAG